MTTPKKLTRKQMIELIQIKEELARRELIRKLQNNFYEFCVYMDPTFFTPGKPHLKLIADALQKVAEGVTKKLAISLPPRAGKSYIISLFCSWVLGREYSQGRWGSIMRNSYAAKLAEKFSKDIRDGILLNEKYLKIFPCMKISKNSGAVDGWSIEGYTQPAYFCAGVGGPITGFGCKTAAILDDPLKNIEEALSETVIENVWNWYTSTHMSRLEIGCPEIHVATRWSKKDPIGRLTDPESESYVPGWEVIVIPALDDDGNSFCEEIKTTEEYHQLKTITEEFIWEAEFMQHPVESKGLLFPIEELNRFSMSDLKSEPDGVVGVVDTADKGSDSLSAPVGKRYGDYTYITDVVFTQDGVEITEPLVARQIIDTKSKVVVTETNNGGGSFARNVRGLIKGKSTCIIDEKTTTQNKETRIIMNAGYIKKYFYFRNDYAPGSDYDRFMRELTSYMKLGKNKHDDAADGTTMLAEYMQENFHLAKPKKELPDKGWYSEDELKDMGYSKMDIKRYVESGVKPWRH